MFSPGQEAVLKNVKDSMRMTCFQIQYFPLPGRKVRMEGGAGARNLQGWGRFKVIGDSRKSASLERGEEMKNNPRVCDWILPLDLIIHHTSIPPNQHSAVMDH